MDGLAVAIPFPTKVSDGCGQFFSTAMHAAAPCIKTDAHVLEIGCAEYNWLKTAETVWPAMTFTGIDWRVSKGGGRSTMLQDDVRLHVFAPESFDWIVSISAIEHIGLGHYDHDPVDPQGDIRVLAKCWDWLRTGGWLYFDVPYNPVRYEVVRTSHRIYDDVAIQARLHQGRDWREHWSGVAAAGDTSRLIPARPRAGGEDFDYIGFWWQKPGA